MSLILDPDDLNNSVTGEITIDTGAKTISINASGNLVDAGATGGVAGQALYSFLKEEWKNDDNLIKHPFPMEAITPEQFEFINEWLPADDASRQRIRTAGWAERTGGAIAREYMGIVSLGTLGETDQPYYQWESLPNSDFNYPGAINEAVQIYGDAGNGNFDYRSTAFNLFAREQAKLYADSDNAAIGATTLTYITYRYPLTNSTDLNISAADTLIATGAPYTNITVEFLSPSVYTGIDVDGDGTGDPFNTLVVVTGSPDPTAQEIYEKVQYLLRQNTDIDDTAGVVTGKVAPSLLSFVGDTLVGAQGVVVSGLPTTLNNSVQFTDTGGNILTFPFTSAGNINFGTFAGAGDFRWWGYVDSTYGTAGAELVIQNDGELLSGTYDGSSYAFDFAFTSNTQGGRTPDVDPLDVKLVGIGLSGGQFASVDFTITRSQGIAVLLAPAQERNYDNP